MRVLLINMPWSPIDVPSLALGILKRTVDEHVPGADAEVLQAQLEFADWITERATFTARDYEYYSLSSYFLGCGDWVFSSALYDDPQWRDAEFTTAMESRLDPERMRITRELHRLAPEFVDEIARKVVAMEPDFVGFTSTFQQNTAVLAAARRIKQLDPRIVTAMGGANCDGEQGSALHRNFPFVDHVVRGEGEAAFPALLNALVRGETDLSEVPGLCHRAADGTSVVNPIAARPLPPAAIPSPDYTGYFERLASSVARNWVEPKLVVEGARGCWWGQKHHCTFCGLNGSFMEFRSKPPETFYDEITSLAARHRVLDMYVVDNILDMGYLTTVLPRMADSGNDLRLHIEIKANMRRHQLRTLAEAGLIYVQPGIESLNSRVLGLMDKGVTGCQNVRMLRDAAEFGLSVSWNYLYGFPGESAEDYDPVITQLPALAHLDPPADEASRIAIERFSPYFNRPELGFSGLRPAGFYSLIYDLPEAELYDLAYVFASPNRGIGKETAASLDAALAAWLAAHPGARLTHTDLGDRVVLVSDRPGFAWRRMELTDPFELAVFRLLDQPHTPAVLARKAAGETGLDAAAAEERVRALLDSWLGLGLVFTDSGHWVQIAPPAVNQALLHLEFMRRAHDLMPEEAPEPAEAPVPAAVAAEPQPLARL
ncbi:RiPP maturation radical SAM C-methyltransferase [Streptomyces sp. NBC_00433]